MYIATSELIRLKTYVFYTMSNFVGEENRVTFTSTNFEMHNFKRITPRHFMSKYISNIYFVLMLRIVKYGNHKNDCFLKIM